MNTPIYDFLKEYKNSEITRFHMPAHKGVGEILPFDLDITEIEGADYLFNPTGIIKKSEENLSDIYESKASIYGVGGSTLCIQTMVALARIKGSKIIAGRNAHTAFVNSCMLLGIEIVWVLPKNTNDSGVFGQVTCEDIAVALQANSDACGVYITSPDYLGYTSDIFSISKLCKEYNVLLLCDNAHGAYLKFTGSHPIDLGVDLCCDSAHKTLPVLTGGAYLHIGKNCEFTYKQAKSKMQIFGSTSPSYLVLASMDLCNEYLVTQAKTDFAKLKEKVTSIYKLAEKQGIVLLKNDVDFAKITFDCNKFGYMGQEVKEVLKQNKIECEYVSEKFVVLMVSPKNSEEDFKRLENAITQLNPKIEICKTQEKYALPKRGVGVNQAVTKEVETVEIENAIGRISAKTYFICPPGIPMITIGEIFDKKIKKICKNCGIFHVEVLK